MVLAESDTEKAPPQRYWLVCQFGELITDMAVEVVSEPVMALIAVLADPPWSEYSVSPLKLADTMVASLGRLLRSNVQNAVLFDCTQLPYTVWQLPV